MMTENGRITWENGTRKLSELIPWPRNPRQVKVDQVRRLQESLTEFGQPETIAIGPGNELYNGHQRLKSWADKFGDIDVDVRVSNRALTEKEREKLTVFLHKGAAGEWDFDILANEFEVDDLLDWGFDEHELDLDLWGVESEEDPGAQIDRTEELREKWGVESGQLWRLGEHRLICGDCTDAEVVDRVMDGERADMVFADPPYGMKLDTDYTKMPDEIVKPRKYPEVIGDGEEFDPTLMLQYFGYCGEQFWWGADYYCWHLPRGGSWFVWDKRNEKNDTAIGSGFELCWSMTPHKRRLLRYIWSGLTAHDPGESRFHPTQKSTTLFEDLIGSYSKDGEIITDPFLGSGTTMIACERLNRKCRGIEISLAYCAVAIQRWVDMTSGEPELIDS